MSYLKETRQHSSPAQYHPALTHGAGIIMLWGVFHGSDREIGQDWGKVEQSKAQRNLQWKPDPELRTLDWAEGSASNRTMTLSSQPRNTGVVKGQLCISLSGWTRALMWSQLNSMERPNVCPLTVPVQPDRALEDQQRGMAEKPQIQVCRACLLYPRRLKAIITTKFA